jgi:hypothetical protein
VSSGAAALARSPSACATPADARRPQRLGRRQVGGPHGGAKRGGSADEQRRGNLVRDAPGGTTAAAAVVAGAGSGVRAPARARGESPRGSQAPAAGRGRPRQCLGRHEAHLRHAPVTEGRDRDRTAHRGILPSRLTPLCGVNLDQNPAAGRTAKNPPPPRRQPARDRHTTRTRGAAPGCRPHPPLKLRRVPHLFDAPPGPSNPLTGGSAAAIESAHSQKRGAPWLLAATPRPAARPRTVSECRPACRCARAGTG